MHGIAQHIHSEADALLIAAAPKLLESLKIAIATADPVKHKWAKEAWQTIAEATGNNSIAGAGR